MIVFDDSVIVGSVVDGAAPIGMTVGMKIFEFEKTKYNVIQKRPSCCSFVDS